VPPAKNAVFAGFTPKRAAQPRGGPFLPVPPRSSPTRSVSIPRAARRLRHAARQQLRLEQRGRALVAQGRVAEGQSLLRAAAAPLASQERTLRPFHLRTAVGAERSVNVLGEEVGFALVDRKIGSVGARVTFQRATGTAVLSPQAITFKGVDAEHRAFTRAFDLGHAGDQRYLGK
jgi:hypothetical protein